MPLSLEEKTGLLKLRRPHELILEGSKMDKHCKAVGKRFNFLQMRRFYAILLLPALFMGRLTPVNPAPKRQVDPALLVAVQNAGFRLPRRHLAAPDFRLLDLSGNEVHLRDFRGKVVLIHFWATWCRPCLRELPRIEALYQRYKTSGFVVLAINANTGSPSQVREFAKKLNFSFPVLLDPKGQVRIPYEVGAFPTSYLVGRDGRFLGRLIGESRWPQAPFARIVEKPL